MMSSLPSLSQSIRPTPPLIDSTMYFLSAEEMCAMVIPAFSAMSSNFGTGVCETWTELPEACGAEVWGAEVFGAGWRSCGLWASATVARTNAIQGKYRVLLGG